MTPVGGIQNNHFVRKATATAPAIAAVALLLVGLPAEARSSGARAFRKSPAKAKTVIRQNEAGDVVIDRIDVTTLEVQGPIFPLEPHNNPQPLCEPSDTVVEFHVHDAGGENADTLDVESEEVTREVVTQSQPHAGPARSLSRIASRLGSIFRPKSSEVAVRPEDVDLDVLLSQNLRIPVEGVDVEKLRDLFRTPAASTPSTQPLSGRRGAVLATTDGR